jgi:hypothetical protein
MLFASDTSSKQHANSVELAPVLWISRNFRAAEAGLGNTLLRNRL